MERNVKNDFSKVIIEVIPCILLVLERPLMKIVLMINEIADGYVTCTFTDCPATQVGLRIVSEGRHGKVTGLNIKTRTFSGFSNYDIKTFEDDERQIWKKFAPKFTKILASLKSHF